MVFLAAAKSNFTAVLSWFAVGTLNPCFGLNTQKKKEQRFYGEVSVSKVEEISVSSDIHHRHTSHIYRPEHILNQQIFQEEIYLLVNYYIKSNYFECVHVRMKYISLCDVLFDGSISGLTHTPKQHQPNVH